MNDMIDMSRFVEAKSDQLNADDLIGAPRTITITRVAGSDGDQPVSIFYQGDNGKPFKPCKTIRRVLMGVWGRYANEYVGKSMTLYRDDKVTFGGLETGGIRISHMSGIDKETVVVVMKTKGKKAGIKILPLKAEQQEDAAANWVATFTANVRKVPTLGALESLIMRGAKNMGGLEANRPELFKECQAAIDTRREYFGPADGQDGPSDTQRGETNTTTPADLLDQIAAATDLAGLSDIDNTIRGLCDEIGARDEQALSEAITRRRGELEDGE
ncbi:MULTISPECIES: hypothetical protein [unclassified Novosphingobium]|uniref:hypothetical protein n=1 Tax=unclassified Novosphingobium TaxID=2644732 RepID=UPI00135B4A3A|nr:MULTISPECIES: hypothetical protein [unclassified Novosphingobium]